ncbi:hypothetical protein LRAMOSA11098 [Lichtheimia ramosa]|uniref:Heterokaryon incompatibility domain-containing protein n=1 Tax=Lichtheimia ramosa TaxID=688394 RepID=A0A077WV79_9FUNG|nr:hypothetical protein LRAMOSA11098 [Lichtheimia ramosa]
MLYDEPTNDSGESNDNTRASLLRRHQRGIRLLDHPHFLLLYVPKDDGSKMKLVKPASDAYHRERLVQKIDDKNLLLPYYALSHLWGTTKENRYHWNDISEYVDDENGQPVKPVSMRPEKRDSLLALLKHHPDSYWWVDVLCARTDTPLVIMGDIYACCNTCYAMIDCEADLIPKINSMMHQLYDGTWTWTLDSYKEAYNTVDIFYQSSWWNRVWTLQEAVLPDEVVFIAETPTAISDSNMLSINDLKKFCDKAWEYIAAEWGELQYKREGEFKRDTTTGFTSSMDDCLDASDIKVVFATAVQETAWCRTYYTKHVTYATKAITPSSINFLFAAFARSSRQCMDPVDYVYGVLGVLQFDVPRKTDANEVWQLFISELQKLVTDPKRITIEDELDKVLVSRYCSDRARECNLLTAENMCQVFGYFYLPVPTFGMGLV